MDVHSAQCWQRGLHIRRRACDGGGVERAAAKTGILARHFGICWAAAAPTRPGTYPIAPLQHGHESGMLARVPWLEGVPLNTSDLPTGPQDSLDAVGGWASRGASALRPA